MKLNIIAATPCFSDCIAFSWAHFLLISVLKYEMLYLQSWYAPLDATAWNVQELFFLALQRHIMLPSVLPEWLFTNSTCPTESINICRIESPTFKHFFHWYFIIGNLLPSTEISLKPEVVAWDCGKIMLICLLCIIGVRSNCLHHWFHIHEGISEIMGYAYLIDCLIYVGMSCSCFLRVCYASPMGDSIRFCIILLLVVYSTEGGTCPSWCDARIVFGCWMHALLSAMKDWCHYLVPSV